MQTLAALADPIRLRLVRLLLREELCVCELQDALGMRQYVVSRHLAALRHTGVVEVERVGRWKYYRVPRAVGPQGRCREMLVAVCEQLNGTVEGIRDDRWLADRLALRRYGRCVIGPAPGGPAGRPSRLQRSLP